MKKSKTKMTVFEFFRKRIDMLQMQHRTRTCETYTSTLHSFLMFRHGQDLRFREMDAEMMELYEAFLKGRGLVRNSTSFYIRILRAVYNLAVEEDLTLDRRPFRHVYTGVDKTVKRAIPLHYIRKIKNLDLTDDPNLDLARDVFLFSFYTRGMSFVDIVFLKKSDLSEGMVSYYRRKTGQRLCFQWEKQMRDIVKKYERDTSVYMLPLIRNAGVDEWAQYRNALRMVNCKLKRIARLIHLPFALTTYVARHSWANVAQEKHIPTSVISEGMGHDSETTTRIYLMSLRTSVIDQANRKILNDI